METTREGLIFMLLKEAINEYSAYKKAKTGSSTLTFKEVSAVRRAWKQGKFEESKNSMPSFKEVVDAYRKFKFNEVRNSKITVEEYESLKENYKKMKSGKTNKAKNPADIMSKVREARVLAYSARKHIKEGDMAAASADVTAAQGAVADAAGAVDATQGQVPQNIVDSVSAIKASVDDLATQCGIQPAVDPNADPNAGVPAVNGAGDPNAGVMMENREINTAAIRERLAAREAQIKAIKEAKGAAIDTTIANPLANIGGQNTAVSERFVDKKNNESTLPTPSLNSLVQGTEKGAIKWPTSKISVKESLAEQVVDKKLKEKSENMSFADILKAGVLG